MAELGNERGIDDMGVEVVNVGNDVAGVATELKIDVVVVVISVVLVVFEGIVSDDVLVVVGVIVGVVVCVVVGVVVGTVVGIVVGIVVGLVVDPVLVPVSVAVPVSASIEEEDGGNVEPGAELDPEVSIVVAEPDAFDVGLGVGKVAVGVNDVNEGGADVGTWDGGGEYSAVGREGGTGDEIGIDVEGDEGGVGVVDGVADSVGEAVLSPSSDESGPVVEGAGVDIESAVLLGEGPVGDGESIVDSFDCEAVDVLNSAKEIGSNNKSVTGINVSASGGCDDPRRVAVTLETPMVLIMGPETMMEDKVGNCEGNANEKDIVFGDYAEIVAE